MNHESETLRVTRSKEQARSSYNKISRWYDVFAGTFEKRPRVLALQKLGAVEGEKVLEIGFGTGHCILDLARSVGDSGRAYGIDISDGMLSIAQHRVDEAGLSGRVELRRGDATELPFASETFDAIFVSFVLELFDTPDIPVVLSECRRVLRKGGRICVAAMSKEGGNSVLVRLYEWGHVKLPNYIDCRPIFVRRVMEAAGLTIVDVTRVSMWGLVGEIVLAMKADGTAE